MLREMYEGRLRPDVVFPSFSLPRRRGKRLADMFLRCVPPFPLLSRGRYGWPAWHHCTSLRLLADKLPARASERNALPFPFSPPSGGEGEIFFLLLFSPK